jgi:phosphate transport system protein
MQRHFVQEIEDLKNNLIRMGSFAEQAIADSIRALLERDGETARRVIEQDKQVDLFEIINDEAVVDLLALQQPVASDLRFILAASKINNDLERIGDHAVNIAESALFCASFPPVPEIIDIPQMAQITKAMLRDSIDGFIHGNTQVCRAVLQSDDLIDKLNRQTCTKLVGLMRKSSKSIEHALELIRVSRNLERVADLATNIAEEVIFATEAMVVKHRKTDKGQAS